MKINKLTVTNENGEEFPLDIITVFKTGSDKHDYLLACDDDDNIFVFKVDEEKQELEVIEDPEILEIAEEILEDLNEENHETLEA